MPGLRKLIERSTIDFYPTIPAIKIKKYLSYLAKNSIEINYHFEIEGNKIEDENPIDQEYFTKIYGTMSDLKDIQSASKFYCGVTVPPLNLNKINYSQEVCQLHFALSFKGRDKLKDFHKKEIRLWDKIRDLTEKYFSENKE